MKKLYTSSLAMLLMLGAYAQVDRVPMIEIFSSSTCPPCKPASDIYNPLLDEFKGQVAVAKYPMSWPGAGDPYFLAEFDTRKNFYSVTGVPGIRVNGSEASVQSFNQTYFEGLLGNETYLDLELKYYIDKPSKTVHFKASMDALDDYFEGEYRMFMIINEKVTYDNATTNGETEFHHIAKKLLPDFSGDLGYSFGDSIFNGDSYDTTGSFQFQGDYRLPSGAGDAIDISSENSIEETDDLEMMLWVNNMGNQEVIQAAVGVKVNSLAELGVGGGEEPAEDPTDPRTWPIGIQEFNAIDFQVFPNPVKDFLNISLSDATDFEVALIDLLGKQVYRNQFSANDFQTINVSELPDGVYMIKISTEHQQHFDRIVIN